MRLIAFYLLLAGLVVAEEKKVPFEEKVAGSKPLEIEPQVIKKGDAILQTTPLLMEKPFLTDWFADGPRSLRVDGDKLQAWFKARDGKDTVHAFTLPKGKGKLAYDTGFGDKGIAPYDRKKSKWKPREDFGDWGDAIVSRKWGEFTGFSHEENEVNQLKIKDAKGKELVVLGKKEGDEELCWLHNFCGWKNLVFVVDGNCRNIVVWTVTGEHLFNIDVDELGMGYPWVQSIDITEEGTIYLGFTQERKNKEGRGKTDVTEAAFLKITGLETIKAMK